MLIGLRTQSTQMLVDFSDSVSQILRLHEDMLSDILRTVPLAELSQGNVRNGTPPDFRRHTRFHSFDLAPASARRKRSNRRLRHSVDFVRSAPVTLGALMTEPKTAASVAKAFSSKLVRRRVRKRSSKD